MRLTLSVLLSIFLFSTIAFAKIRVVTAYPYIADIAKKIGKNKIKVDALARGSNDPHHIVARPSLIVKLRKADMLIINGAELEIGWMPPILRDCRNSSVQPGNPGFIELSVYMKLIQVPKKVSRAMGDVHPAGNPHFNLNPDNVIKIARVIMSKLCKLDVANRSFYRNNYSHFKRMWKKKITQWKEALKPMKGKRILQYHRSHDYFLRYFGIKSAGELEPLPGIPPTSKHIIKTIKKVKARGIIMITQDVYHPIGPSRMIADRTGARVVILPHDVGAVKQAKDIVSLYDEIVRRLVK